MKPFSTVIIGNESLLVQCSEILLDRGHTITAIVTQNDKIGKWASGKGLRLIDQGQDLVECLDGLGFDWVLSIANLQVLPQAVLDMANQGAVNFHDGPLPSYAGLNAPVWALLNGEKRHGVTWHLIENGIDKGDILEQRMFDLSKAETALTLNSKCFEAAIDSFPALLSSLEAGASTRVRQNLLQRSYFGRDDRPEGAGLLDFYGDAAGVVTLVNALDHGTYLNPICSAKVALGDTVLFVGSAELAGPAMDAAPGTVLEISDSSFVVATGSVPVRLGQLRDVSGADLHASEVMQAGDIIPVLVPAKVAKLHQALKTAGSSEGFWRKRLSALKTTDCLLAEKPEGPSAYKTRKFTRPEGLSDRQMMQAYSVFVGRMGGVRTHDLAFSMSENTSDFPAQFICDWVPVRLDARDAAASYTALAAVFERALERAEAAGLYPADLITRDPAIDVLKTPDFGLAVGDAPTAITGTCMTLCISGADSSICYDASRLSEQAVDVLLARFDLLMQSVASGEAAETRFDDLPMLPKAERDAVVHGFNETDRKYDDKSCVHQFFEAQVAKTPDATAVVFEDETLSYHELNARANQVAHVLQAMGVSAGQLIGLYTERSLDLLIGALAIQKAGGAYVPLDPSYPQSRLAHYINDSRLAVIVTQSGLSGDLPTHSAALLEIDTDQRVNAASETNPDSGVTSGDLAYMIYTSGSTGTPKGVMVEHKNVSNFFTGMDERIDHNPPGVWLAVTSLSFDISVLELFYTLARGFKLVIASDQSRVVMSDTVVSISEQPMEFSLYFWGNDDGVGPKKYELLLEAAKFADENGFCAVWTPERHFHAFGGPYPNPAITGAAVAAVTKNLAVRSGSCVAPLHHTARIAEEWAVIDNLTNGRTGLGIASGWQPDDFVLRPENTPPNNKPAMFQAIKDLRKLWRGEAVEFPTQSGKPFAVVTQPRPVSKELPIWVTIAGNPETWREAGEIGANVLTHLLGQTVDEVSERITLYHAALRKAGHNPADFKVTLMLHSFVGQDRQKVRETARGPMKAYMGAAAGLIKQCAWAFPAFKRPKGVTSPFDIDLATLEADEVDAILEFAFERYFEDAGLFGTVEDCLKRVEQIKNIGVSEVACLIDYGIPVPVVLESLRPLAEVLRRANIPSELAPDDYSIAAQIARHKVTHLQCTPSMAQLITMDDAAGRALGQLQQIFVGGEALSGALVSDIAKYTAAPIENMYGPTEATVWSSSETATAGKGLVNIGTPIANTQLYVLDDDLAPQPFGVPGELYIGGAGVTRGYWQVDALTAERFVENPFVAGPQRMYRTGDLVRRRLDGKIDFLGRVDHQVKLRGYRIELGEIESVLEGIAEIRQAVVVAREDTPGDIRLVAYFRADGELANRQIRAHLSEKLPDYMIPSHFVAMAEFPLTPNKKVDRKALPAPMAKPRSAGQPGAEPTRGIEAKIATVWSHVLGVQNIGPADNFFDLGGHSLLAVQAHREIRAALGTTDLSITDIFRFPVLKMLAAHLQSSVIATIPQSKPDPSVMADRAQQRTDAMAKRRAMRARRNPG